MCVNYLENLRVTCIDFCFKTVGMKATRSKKPSSETPLRVSGVACLSEVENRMSIAKRD